MFTFEALARGDDVETDDEVILLLVALRDFARSGTADRVG